MGVFFGVRTSFGGKKKVDATWKSHCDGNLWMWHWSSCFLHGLILITRAIQEKVFHEEAFITFASLLLPFSFGKERIWDFSKASWFLLGFGVEVGLAPNTPPTPSFKTFCDPGGCAKGIMPCILGREANLQISMLGGVPHVPKYCIGGGQIKWVPLKHKMWWHPLTN